MLALRLSKEIEEELTDLAKRTGRTKSYYAKKAIEEFLEDQKYYLIAASVLESNLPTLSLSEVEKMLEVED